MKLTPLLALTLALAAFVTGLLFAGATWPLYAAGGCAGVAMGMVWSGRAVARELAVRTLVVAAYEAGFDNVKLRDVSVILDTPDVREARAEAHRREAELWAGRYANGEASER